jgi:two-component system chemotaxis response regulator CheB
VQTHDVVVIGGSAGALSGVKELLRGLPAGFPAAVFVVIHTAPDSAGALPSILEKAGSLPARTAVDGEPIRSGHVYIAPPDHHLLLKHGYLRVTRGPRENSFRPAVDPLFRTAALAYGERVVGVVFSGGRDDGTLGIVEIRRQGGVAIVQDPRQAEAPGMPESALSHAGADYVLRTEDMAAVVTGLVGHHIEEGAMTGTKNPPQDVAEAGADALASGSLPGPPSPFTCPECGGALWELREGELVRFQCHVGHGYNGDSLVVAQGEALEMALWTALRALEEGAALRRRMAKHARSRGMRAIAEGYDEQAQLNEDRAHMIRQVVTGESSPVHALSSDAGKR